MRNPFARSDRDAAHKWERVRVYYGARDEAGCHAWILDREGVQRLAPPGVTLRTAIDWGRPGPFADELAWAMIEDCTGDRRLADDWHRCLAREVVASLPRASFCLTAEDILLWLDATGRTEPSWDTYPEADHR